MRSPQVVISNLANKSQNPSYKYERLYRNLYNREFFLSAYAKLYAKEGNMTEGTDKQTIDGMSLERIDKIIESLKDLSYQPRPAKRVYIPKKNGDKRPLGIPSINDKLVQEVVRMILEAIYEEGFHESSHGFRPNRSCHTALNEIHKNFKGTSWFIEGDIKGFFDNIDHRIMTDLLRKRIKDEKFIDLIWKFLKAGYLEDWKYHGSFSGTPQGGIISPILSNIYLNELDHYITKYSETFNKGNRRKINKEYHRLVSRISNLKKKYENSLEKKEKLNILEQIKELRKQAKSLNSIDYMDNSYKRIRYVRYADDFLVCIIGSKADAGQVKADLTNFLSETLKLELSQEKTLITNSKDSAKFLGYEISIKRSSQGVKDKNGVTKRQHNGNVCLKAPKDVWVNKLKSLKAIQFTTNKKWEPIQRNFLVNYDDLEIITQYNSEIRGLYEYYKMAENVPNTMHRFTYFMFYSMLKTYGRKYKTSISKIIKKHSKDGVFRIEYQTKKGKKYRQFVERKFPRVKSVNKDSRIDEPVKVFYLSRNGLIKRMLANKCEWCGREDDVLEVHHVRKLKDLKGKKIWEQMMIARQRKTMVLCKSCHVDLHAGRLD